MIRFLNGSVYRYFGMGENLMNILSATSKGKWVWRFLRRAGVPYEKIGVLPLPDDLTITDEELFDLGDQKYFEEMVAYVGATRKIVETPLGKMEYIEVMGREIWRVL